MPCPQFTVRALLAAVLVVAGFFGGIQFERERQRREDEAAARAADSASRAKAMERSAARMRMLARIREEDAELRKKEEIARLTIEQESAAAETVLSEKIREFNALFRDKTALQAKRRAEKVLKSKIEMKKQQQPASFQYDRENLADLPDLY